MRVLPTAILSVVLSVTQNGPIYLTLYIPCRGNYSAASNYEVGTLAVDGWTVTFGTARMGLGGAPVSLYNSPLLCDVNKSLKGQNKDQNVARRSSTAPLHF